MIKRNYQTKKPSRRPDLTAIRDALKDDRCWACFGLVVAGEDGNHFEIVENSDVLIEVSLMPKEERITCRLGSMAGGPGRGVWAIPPVGTEVAVLVPDGEIDATPIIVATLSTGDVTTDLDDTIIVMSNSLGDIAVVPNGDVSLGVKGATEQALRGNSFQTRFNDLVTQFNAFVTAFNEHDHTGVTAGGGTSGAPSTPSSAVGTPSNSADLSPNVKVQ